MRYKIIRTSTIPGSLNVLLKGQLRFLNKYFNVIALSGYNKTLELVRDREGVEIIGCSMERKISPFRDLISLLKLIFIFIKEKPVIVHSITPKAGLLTMLAAKITGVPIRIHTFTGLIFPTEKGIRQRLLIRMDMLLCSAATNIYPEGNGVKEDLLSYNITSKPLKVIANGNVNGIDLNFFNPNHISIKKQVDLKKHLGIDIDDFVFIFVGRLVRDKGINELVQAFINLTKTHGSRQKNKLLLVGNFESKLDPLQTSTLNHIKDNKNIIFAGYQLDVRPYFSISDVLVLPSYREGFPNVVLQAGAMGLPSIVTNISGCNEIIVEGVNGMIIPVKDIDEIESAMRKLIDDKYLFNSLSSISRKMIENRYEQKIVWDALLKEYSTLLQTNGFYQHPN